MNARSLDWAVTRVPSVLIKATMALTGLLMAGWLTLHMVGNLLIFGGADLFNAYAARLRETGLLWPMRAVLLSALSVHALSAAATSLRAWAARPVRYHAPLRAAASTLGSRTMRAGGALLLGFLVYHVATLYGAGHPSYVAGDVYSNLVALLRKPAHAALYACATGLVTLHLAHGLRSSLQSLGWTFGKREAFVRRALQIWTGLVTLGFVVPIVATIMGWV